MGQASLGFDSGPSIDFRIDPNDIHWEFQIETAVIETLGGRVVQVVGATLGDLMIFGGFGENKKQPGDSGASWRLADTFARRIREMMEYQSRGSTVTGKILQSPAIFSYPPKGWKFAVTIMDLADPQGGSVGYSTGKFAHEYQLSLFIVEDLSPSTSQLGSNGGVVKAKADAAVESYINRITQGFGWKASEYNGPQTPATAGPPAGSEGQGTARSAEVVTPGVGN